MASKLKCGKCGKISDEAPRQGLRCGRCGNEISIPPSGKDFFQPPERNKASKHPAKKKVQQKKKRAPAERVNDNRPPPIVRPFDYGGFFQKAAQIAVVAGVSSFVMLIVFMSIDGQREGGRPMPERQVVVQTEATPAKKNERSSKPEDESTAEKPTEKEPGARESTKRESADNSDEDRGGSKRGGSATAGTNESVGPVGPQDATPEPSSLKNHPPEFPDQKFLVAGNASEGKEIGTLQASDPDGDDLTFEILDNVDLDRDKQNGVKLSGDRLVVNDADDFRGLQQRSIKLRARASDGQLGDVADILLNLEKILAIQSIKDHRGVEMAVGLIEDSVEVIDRVTKAKRYSKDLRVLKTEEEFNEILLDDGISANHPDPKIKKLYERIKKDLHFKGRYAVASGGHGSCFLISSDGYAITNWHVVRAHLEAQNPSSKKFYKQLSDNLDKYTGFRPQLIVFLGEKNKKRYHKARVVHVSPVKDEDIAIIKIEDVSDSPYFKLAKYEDIQPLTDVYSLGYPGANRKSGTSEKDRKKLEMNEGSLNPDDWHPNNHLTLDRDKGIVNKIDVHPGDLRIVQHTAELSGGNSGGPLVTDDGHVVGINHSGSAGAKHFYATPPFSIQDELNKFPQIMIDWVEITTDGAN